VNGLRNLAEQMVNAEATLWQMNAGMALLGMGTGGESLSMERATDLQIQSSPLERSLFHSFALGPGDRNVFNG
jgi:hypothetical protein